mmetsp:Transcript_59714/g.172325  ORF Transcript_59714/g.172325 Transcript_59714/m.172325 type:complete len:503 (-) Transcript_59714:303-1811(-)
MAPPLFAWLAFAAAALVDARRFAAGPAGVATAADLASPGDGIRSALHAALRDAAPVPKERGPTSAEAAGRRDRPSRRNRLAAFAAAAAASSPARAAALHSVVSPARRSAHPAPTPPGPVLGASRSDTSIRMAEDGSDSSMISEEVQDMEVADGEPWGFFEEDFDWDLPERPVQVEPPWMSMLRGVVQGLEERRSSSPFGDRRFFGSLRSSGRRVEVVVVETGTSERRRAIRNELRVLSRCSGGDVLALFGVASDGDSSTLALRQVPPDASAVFFFMEPSDLDFEEVLLSANSGGVPRGREVRMLVEILRGLLKLQEAGFVHRDLRPENIRIVGDCHSQRGCHAKISGFRCACKAKKARRGGEPEIAGDPMYIAPEVWKGRVCSKKADVWSAGLVAYQLFVGGFPNDLISHAVGGHRDLTKHPLRGFVPLKFDIKSDARFQEFRLEDAETADLIASLLRRSPRFRPSLRRALQRAEKIARKRGVHVPEQRSRFSIEVPEAEAS